MSTRFSYVLITIILSIVLISCGSKNDQTKTDSAQSSVSERDAQQAPDSIAGMQLNDGKKWMMDEHTRSSFKKMVESLPALGNSSAEGLQNTGMELRGQINTLLKGCTMDGDAHNQLHIFMTGYIPAVDSLTSSTNITEAKEQAQKIKGFLDAYDVYFE